MAFTAHLRQALQGFQFFLLFIDDVPLHLQGAGAWPRGGHRDFRLVHIRGQLHRQPEQRDGAKHDDEDHAHRGRYRMANAGLNEIHGTG